jgi:hypothetical protein
MSWKTRFERLRNMLRFRHLGWKLTLSYTLVTVATLLVVEVLFLGTSWSTFSTSKLMNYFASFLDERVVPQVRPFLETAPPDAEGARVYLGTLYTRGIEGSPGEAGIVLPTFVGGLAVRWCSLMLRGDM